MIDPEPVLDATASELIFYQVSGNPTTPIQLVKDRVQRTVIVYY